MIKLDSPLLEALDELNKLAEAPEEDPYGYGPYKEVDNPTLMRFDYIKAKRYPNDHDWYPAEVTEVTPDFVSYRISGFGFEKKGVAVRSAKAKNAFSKLKRHLGEGGQTPEL